LVKAVVLDANALLMPFQFRMNLDKEISRLLGEIRVLVPSSVLHEISRLKTREAKAAMALARKYEVVETELAGDDGVLDVAVRNEAAVVTNDRELMSRLKEVGLPVVRLRSERYLVLTGQGAD
jgi:rRNA-processing protein FCF1